jgi:hypothetical protein
MSLFARPFARQAFAPLARKRLAFALVRQTCLPSQRPSFDSALALAIDASTKDALDQRISATTVVSRDLVREGRSRSLVAPLVRSVLLSARSFAPPFGSCSKEESGPVGGGSEAVASGISVAPAVRQEPTRRRRRFSSAARALLVAVCSSSLQVPLAAFRRGRAHAGHARHQPWHAAIPHTREH